MRTKKPGLALVFFCLGFVKLVRRRLIVGPEYVPHDINNLTQRDIGAHGIQDKRHRVLCTGCGDPEAIGAEERRGYEFFQSYGCIGCHQGVALGGNMFQRLGVVRDYFADRGDVTRADLGRFNVTGREADRHVFKVPTLRNVALTAPYFHDGSAPSLDDAVRVMARYQLGRDIPAADRAAIVAFLRSLTGELPESS